MYRVDSTDRAIVDLLMRDGRMSCAEISRHLSGVSERSVRYRIERLIENRVIHVGAIVNPKAVGFAVTADVLMEIEPGHVREVAQKMADLEQVSYVACATGDRDLSIQVQARDNDELYRFVTEVVGRVPAVRKTNTVLVPVVLKDVYDWRIPESATQGGKESDTGPESRPGRA